MNCYDTCITTVFMYAPAPPRLTLLVPTRALRCSLIDEDRAGDCGDSYIPYVPPSLAKLMDNVCVLDHCDAAHAHAHTQFKEVDALERDYKAKVRHATVLKKGGKVETGDPKKSQVAPSDNVQQQDQGES